MIITDKIIWPHIPKTAGSKTRDLLLCAYRDKVLLNTDDHTLMSGERAKLKAKGIHPHTKFIPEEFQDKKRKCVIGFRGLFSWLMSKANYHFVMHRVDLTRKEIIDILREGKTIKQNCEVARGDEFISEWMHFIDPPNGKYADILDDEPIFVRQEYYEKDMRKALLCQEHYLTDEELDAEFILKQNTIADCVQHQYLARGKEPPEDKMPIRVKDLELTEELVEYIYAQNPLWDKLEKQIYNDS